MELVGLDNVDTMVLQTKWMITLGIAACRSRSNRNLRYFIRMVMNDRLSTHLCYYAKGSHLEDTEFDG